LFRLWCTNLYVCIFLSFLTPITDKKPDASTGEKSKSFLTPSADGKPDASAVEKSKSFSTPNNDGKPDASAGEKSGTSQCPAPTGSLTPARSPRASETENIQSRLNFRVKKLLGSFHNHRLSKPARRIIVSPSRAPPAESLRSSGDG
jgi:hypothetical protein